MWIEKPGDDAGLDLTFFIGLQVFGVAGIIGPALWVDVAGDKQIFPIGRDSLARRLPVGSRVSCDAPEPCGFMLQICEAASVGGEALAVRRPSGAVRIVGQFAGRGSAVQRHAPDAVHDLVVGMIGSADLKKRRFFNQTFSIFFPIRWIFRSASRIEQLLSSRAGMWEQERGQATPYCA